MHGRALRHALCALRHAEHGMQNVTHHKGHYDRLLLSAIFTLLVVQRGDGLQLEQRRRAHDL